MKMPDKESIQSFFINHSEKICFLAVVLCFFMIIWKAFSLPKLDIKPENLKSGVESAQRNLDATDSIKDLLPPFNFVEEAQVAIAPVQTAALRASTPYDPPLFQPRDKREQPEVLAVRSLQGSSGNGAFGSTAPNFMESLANYSEMGAGMRTGMGTGLDRTGRQQKEKNGIRWVVITGIIPFADQQKKFEDTFKNAQVKTQNDFPVYRGYLIERAEVNPANPKALKWEKLDIREAIKDNKRLAGGGSEVVDTKYLLQTGTSFNMAMGLLNIANHRWGLDCAHLPEIPMIKTRYVGGGMDLDEDEMGEGTEDELANNTNPEELDPLADPTNINGMGPNGTLNTMEEMSEFRLLRFFDTKVEPGKRYCYRFKLVINNPNYDVAPRYVKKEEWTKNKLLESDWSEPSGIIEVPRDSRVLCVGNRDKEDIYGPAGQIMVVQFEENSGAEIYKSFEELGPGKWLNFKNVTLIDPSRMSSSSMMAPDDFDLGGERLTAAQKKERQAEKRRLQKEKDAKMSAGPKVDFLSNCLLMDTAGGDKIPGVSIPLPSRTLILNADGKLVIHSEMTDKPEVYLRTKEPEKKQDPSIDSELDPTGKKTKNKNRKPVGADII